MNSDAEGKVRIVLDGASITNTAGSAMVITAADEAVVVLADGSENVLTDGTGYDTSADDAPNAALFSMADLTIGGTGSLTVTGNTERRHRQQGRPGHPGRHDHRDGSRRRHPRQGLPDHRGRHRHRRPRPTTG